MKNITTLSTQIMLTLMFIFTVSFLTLHTLLSLNVFAGSLLFIMLATPYALTQRKQWILKHHTYY